MRQGRVWGGGRSEHSNGIVNSKIGYIFIHFCLFVRVHEVSQQVGGQADPDLGHGLSFRL